MPFYELTNKIASTARSCNRRQHRA